MKMIPFPEHLDEIVEGNNEHIIIDSDNYVVCNDDGSSFQVTVEDGTRERVPDVEVAWDDEAKAWRVVP